MCFVDYLLTYYGMCLVEIVSFGLTKPLSDLLSQYRLEGSRSKVTVHLKKHVFDMLNL